jgi:gluconokinase
MFLVIMGVSGCGKTTIGQKLAERLGWPFYDGDDFHPPANIAKMSSGIPLDDNDRRGWLERLATLIQTSTQAGQNGVLACSALKQVYRDQLMGNTPKAVRFIHLKGSYTLILERMQQRGSHFMKPEMLKSQFQILEEPAESLNLSISLSVEDIVQQIIDQEVKKLCPPG